jgi:hypothetical protein
MGNPKDFLGLQTTKADAIKTCELVLEGLDRGLAEDDYLSPEDRSRMELIRSELSLWFCYMAGNIEDEVEEEENDARMLGMAPDHTPSSLDWLGLTRIMWACIDAGSFLNTSDVLERMIKKGIYSSAGARGGKKSSESRRANRKWIQHAEELAMKYVVKNPEKASQANIASEILSGWKLGEVNPPGYDTLKTHIAQMQAENRLPRRVAKPLRSTG